MSKLASIAGSQPGRLQLHSPHGHARHRLRSATSEKAALPLPRPRVALAAKWTDVKKLLTAIDLDIKRKLEKEVADRWFVPKDFYAARSSE
jgi:hypothetical protein